MTVVFDSESEEAAVEAVDSLGDAFAEHLTGWAASVKSIRTAQDETVPTFKPPVTITAEHWDEQQPKKLIDMPELNGEEEAS